MPHSLKDALMGGPGLNGYVYNADVYCVDCGRDIIRRVYADAGNEVLDDLDFQDSEICPQPIFFGEADSAQHCGDCGEYMYGDRPDEPDEDSIVTEDHRRFYQYGKQILDLDEDADFKAALREYMDRAQFWPNVFWISDHGNAHLIDMTEE